MTVASQVKLSLASLKGIHAGLQTYAIKANDIQAQKVFHEAVMITEEMICDLKKRVVELERLK